MRKLASFKERVCAVDTVSRLRIIAVLFILFTVVSNVSVLGVKTADVEDTIVEAYGAVLEAEEAGADVSALLDRLDMAGEYWALARMSLRTGNMEGAAGNATLSVEALDELVEDAGVLRDKAIMESGERSWMAIGGSIGGVAAVVCGGWLSWNWFKKRYNERALKMRPEVV